MRGSAAVTVLAAVAAGVVVALIVTAVEPTRYRAETTIVVQRGAAPLPDDPRAARLVHTLASLVTTDVVLSNVVRNLGLSGTSSRDLRGRVHVSTVSHAALFRIGVDDESRTAARRVAQELALVFTQIVHVRFGGTGGVTAEIFDPVHTSGKVSPRPLRNVAFGLVVGALVGIGAALAPRTRKPAAPRARPPEPAPEPQPEPQPEPEQEPEPGAEAPPAEPRAPVLLQPRMGEWSVAALASLVEARAPDYPERADEWRMYLEYLGQHAVDGVLPPAFDSLVADVFGDVVDASPS